MRAYFEGRVVWLMLGLAEILRRQPLAREIVADAAARVAARLDRRPRPS